MTLAPSAAPRPARRALLLAMTLLCFSPPGQSAASGVPLSFGANDDGQAGLGMFVDETLVATPIDDTNLAGRSITRVAAGHFHSLLLADDGTAFAFGVNANGRTGLNTASGVAFLATPIDVSNLEGQPIVALAAGGEHSLVLAADGTVFAFGNNQRGATGLGTAIGQTLVATPIHPFHLADRAITQVAAGNNHSLLLADDGTVLSFGHNFAFQTGLDTAAGSTLFATPIDTTNLDGRTITQIASGHAHSLLLADDGTVFSFGWNDSGRTGQGFDGEQTPLATQIATPIIDTNLDGRTIVQVSAGQAHSLLLADDGTVFSFGSNFDGRTGLGTDTDFTPIATPIDMTNLAGKTITQVAAGQSHSLLLADDGTVFAFGLNASGQTGLGTADGNTLIATPIDMTNLAGLTVAGISAGNFHSLLAAAAPGLPGDFNGDGVVDAADYTVWRDGLGTAHTANDYELWKENFGAGTAAGASVSPIPEPTVIALLLSAALPLLLARTRTSPRIEPHAAAPRLRLRGAKGSQKT